jgi:N-acetylneuraminic acid mutarotase
MSTGRYWHTATLLPNGQVLVAGGFGPNGIVATAELYDPASETWTNTGSFSDERIGHLATLLLNGQVLMAGGWNETVGTNGLGGDLSSAELYDPASGRWTNTGSLTTARGHTAATLLPGGQVLVSGGYDENLPAFLSSAEIYDPASGTWTATGPMTAVRADSSVTLLANGQVLVAGGWNGNIYLWSAELYNSGTGPLARMLPGGAFQFAFTRAPFSTNTVLATTNLALVLTNWTVLGVAPEFSSGLFLFTDQQATNKPQCFYGVRSP